jgi:cytochrome c2
MTGPSMLAMVTRALAMRAMMLIPAIVLIASAVRADGDAARGEKLYDDCVACHPVEAGVHGIGPTLHGIVGRKVGEIADYRYSAALRRSGITWTAEALDTFIGDPQASVPANRMPYAGMTNAGDRADLIAYLKKVSR